LSTDDVAFSPAEAGQDVKDIEGRVLCGPAFYVVRSLFPAIKSRVTSQVFRFIVILNEAVSLSF